MLFDLAELRRALHNLIHIGTVTEVDYAAAAARITIGHILTDWLPWTLTDTGPRRIAWQALQVGEQVVVLSPGGDLATGIIIGSLYQAQYPRPSDNPDVHQQQYADGASISYNQAQHTLHATLPDGATTVLHSPGGVKIIGDVHVEGHISASQDIRDKVRTMAADRSIYNRHRHTPIMPPPMEQQ